MTKNRCGCRRLAGGEFGRKDRWHYLALKTSAEMLAILDELLEQLRQRQYSEHDLFAVRLAMEEAVVNAIRHGHRGDISKTVLVGFCLEETFFLAQVEDEGPGFVPDEVPDPREADEQKPGGRGLLLMQHYMDAIEFNPTGNCVTMCKHRSPAGGTS